jgi:hypothetical protein
MGRYNYAPVLRNLGAKVFYRKIQGTGKKVFHFPFDVVLLIDINLITCFFRIIGKGQDKAVRILAPGKAGRKIRKKAEDVNFFLGGCLHAKKGEYAHGRADFGEGRAVEARIVIRQGKGFYAMGRRKFSQIPGRQFQGTAGREARMVMKIS